MSGFNSYTHALDLMVWRDLCRQHGTCKRFKKGAFFAKQGEHLHYCGLVLKGGLKFVATDADGNEHVTGMVFGGDLVGDFLSVAGQGPMRTDIVAATDAEVLVCDVARFKSILAEQPKLGAEWATAMFRQAYEQYLELHVKSPKERYVALLRRWPDIVQNVTLKEIASYLKITPTHLSRIRKELTFAGQKL